MSDRTGQVWRRGDGAIFIIVAPASISDDPPDWTFGVNGVHKHRAFELETGYETTLVELTGGDWETDDFHKRLL